MKSKFIEWLEEEIQKADGEGRNIRATSLQECLLKFEQFSSRPPVSKQMIEEMTALRNKLYDSLPSGEITAFELIKVIKNYLTEFDEIIDGFNACLSMGAQTEAIEFAEWCPNNGFKKVKTNGDHVWVRNNIGYSSLDIYKNMFIPEKLKEKTT